MWGADSSEHSKSELWPCGEAIAEGRDSPSGKAALTIRGAMRPRCAGWEAVHRRTCWTGKRRALAPGKYVRKQMGKENRSHR
jgi:hypothetical protein